MGLNNSLFFAEHATESSIESQKVTPKKNHTKTYDWHFAE